MSRRSLAARRRHYSPRVRKVAEAGRRRQREAEREVRICVVLDPAAPTEVLAAQILDAIQTEAER